MPSCVCDDILTECCPTNPFPVCVVQLAGVGGASEHGWAGQPEQQPAEEKAAMAQTGHPDHPADARRHAHAHAGKKTQEPDTLWRILPSRTNASCVCVCYSRWSACAVSACRGKTLRPARLPWKLPITTSDLLWRDCPPSHSLSRGERHSFPLCWCFPAANFLQRVTYSLILIILPR